MSKALSQDQIDEAREAFNLADKAGAGVIKPKEVPVVMRALGLDPSEDDITAILAGAGDSVTFKEFLSLVGDKMNEVLDNEDLRVAFRVFDRDGQETEIN